MSIDRTPAKSQLASHSYSGYSDRLSNAGNVDGSQKKKNCEHRQLYGIVIEEFVEDKGFIKVWRTVLSQ